MYLFIYLFNYSFVCLFIHYLPQLFILRQLHKAPEGTPQLLMENNFRPPMPMNRRTVRTNITPKKEVITAHR